MINVKQLVQNLNKNAKPGTAAPSLNTPPPPTSKPTAPSQPNNPNPAVAVIESGSVVSNARKMFETLANRTTTPVATFNTPKLKTVVSINSDANNPNVEASSATITSERNTMHTAKYGEPKQDKAPQDRNSLITLSTVQRQSSNSNPPAANQQPSSVGGYEKAPDKSRQTIKPSEQIKKPVQPTNLTPKEESNIVRPSDVSQNKMLFNMFQNILQPAKKSQPVPATNNNNSSIPTIHKLKQDKIIHDRSQNLVNRLFNFAANIDGTAAPVPEAAVNVICSILQLQKKEKKQQPVVVKEQPSILQGQNNLDMQVNRKKQKKKMIAFDDC